MITRFFGVALGAGCAAGLAFALLQIIFTTPLILEAEKYEFTSSEASLVQPAIAHAGQAGVFAAAGEAENAAEEHSGLLDGIFGDWTPEDGLERTLFTALSSVLVGFGFGLMLIAAMVFGARKIDAATGLLWGLGGFAAVALAPALGLPPELPGSAAADLAERQVWWIGTTLATALGLWLVVSREQMLLKAAGVLLLIAPHAFGAPHVHEYASRVPAELQGHFVAASLVLAGVFWALLGSISGYLWQRGEAR